MNNAAYNTFHILLIIFVDADLNIADAGWICIHGFNVYILRIWNL